MFPAYSIALHRSQGIKHIPICASALVSVLFLSCNHSDGNRNEEPVQRKTEDVAGATIKPWFADVTKESGIHFTYRNGEEANHYSILESLGGGVGLIDYNQDGQLDVLLTGGGSFKGEEILGHSSKLFRNEGGWKFSDVTAEAGLDSPLFYTHGVAVGDFNDDGWSDVLITGYGRMALYRNDKGKFTEITELAGLMDSRPVHWSTSAAWADFNGDGRLDLFVPHYVDWSFSNHPKCNGYIPGQQVDVCPPEKFSPLPPSLYMNQGDGTFIEADNSMFKPGKALGVVAADLDDDGAVDIYVANDGIPNHLYKNQGKGEFKEIAEAAGVAYDADGGPNGSMGVDVGDVDGDGKLAIFVANYENEMHCLYRNVGPGLFQCVSRPTGITAIGQSYVAFGTGLVDFNHDGALDLFICNGHVIRHPAKGEREQKPVLLRNMHMPGSKGSARFVSEPALGGSYFESPHVGRGLAFGDLDNDGRVDAVINHSQEPVAVLRNVHESANAWLGLSLKGDSPRDAVGTKVTLVHGKTTQVAIVKGGGSYLSAGDRRIVFGLGNSHESFRIQVRWPDGQEQELGPSHLAANRYTEIRKFPGPDKER